MFWKVLGCRWMLLVVYSMSRDVLLVVLLLTNGGLSISLGLEEIRPTKSADRRKNKKEGKMAFVMKLCQIGYGCGLAHNPTTPAAALTPLGSRRNRKRPKYQTRSPIMSMSMWLFNDGERASIQMALLR